MNAEEIAKILDELTVRLTPAAQETFAIIAQRVVAESIITLVAGIVVAIATIVGTWAVWRYAGKYHERSIVKWQQQERYRLEPDTFGMWLFRIVALSIAAIIGTIAFGRIIISTINLLSPEYATIERLISLATGTL